MWGGGGGGACDKKRLVECAIKPTSLTISGQDRRLQGFLTLYFSLSFLQIHKEISGCQFVAFVLPLPPPGPLVKVDPNACGKFSILFIYLFVFCVPCLF